MHFVHGEMSWTVFSVFHAAHPAQIRFLRRSLGGQPSPKRTRQEFLERCICIIADGSTSLCVTRPETGTHHRGTRERLLHLWWVQTYFSLVLYLYIYTSYRKLGYHCTGRCPGSVISRQNTDNLSRNTKGSFKKPSAKCGTLRSCLDSFTVNSSWPSDAIWRHKSGSTLAQATPFAWQHQAIC